MRLIHLVVGGVIATIMAFALTSPAGTAMRAAAPDECQNPPPGTPGLLQGSDASTVSGPIYITFDSSFTNAERTAIEAGIKYWPENTTTYSITFGAPGPNDPPGTTINVFPDESLGGSTAAKAYGGSGNPGNIGIRADLLAAANDGTTLVTMNFLTYEGAHEWGHNLGFSHVGSDQLSNSVMATGLSYGDLQNWAKPSSMLTGDGVAFRGKYKINPSDPDNPCDQPASGGGTDSTIVDIENSWYECWIDIVIVDYYFWNGDAWEWFASDYYYSEPYNCVPLE